MTDLRNPGDITAFVRGTLGCGCPDRVFETIDTDPVDVGDLATSATRIVVGETLLVYIVVPGSISDLTAGMHRLAELGRHDRDSHAYNRFRLVIADDGDSRLHDQAAASFAAAGADEKMHIHFVHPAAVSGD